MCLDRGAEAGEEGSSVGTRQVQVLRQQSTINKKENGGEEIGPERRNRTENGDKQRPDPTKREQFLLLWPEKIFHPPFENKSIIPKGRYP